VQESFLALNRYCVLNGRDPGGFPAPLLLMHGSADRVNCLSESQAVADQLGDACTLLVYDGIPHQPHTDPESPRMFADVIGLNGSSGADPGGVLAPEPPRRHIGGRPTPPPPA
jgi:hypothetical protein